MLSHGWTCSTLFWAGVIRQLTPEFRVVAYDQRGHGRSDVPRESRRYTTDALADDLQAVLVEVLPDGRQAVFAGHSMGGMTLMAAADRPAVRARIAAALLASTGSGRLIERTLVLPPRVSNAKVRAAFHRAVLVSSAPMGPQGPLLRKAIKYGVMGAGSTPEQVAFTVGVVHACARQSRSEWGKVLNALDLDAKVGALTAPTAVLVGTGDKLTPAGARPGPGRPPAALRGPDGTAGARPHDPRRGPGSGRRGHP